MSDAIRAATSPKPTDRWVGGRRVTRRPTAREAFRDARAAITGDKPVVRDSWDRAVIGLTAGMLAARRVRKAEKVRARKLEAAREAKAARVEARKVEAGVAATVRRSGDSPTADVTRKPAPSPIPKRETGSADAETPKRTPEASSGGAMSSTPSAIGQMIDLAEQMVEVITKYERPAGILELLDREYKRIPELQRTVAKALKVLHERATDPTTGDPLPPVIMDLLEELFRHQERNARTAEEIVPLARILVGHKIDALHDKRNRMWDHRVNEDYL